MNSHQLNTAASFDEQMREIYTEFRVSIFPDAQEAYNNYRRTGYPALTPMLPFPGRGLTT